MRRGLLLASVCLLSACGERGDAEPPIWIHTAIDQHVIDAIQPHLEEAVPEGPEPDRMSASLAELHTWLAEGGVA